jgi:antitoxin CcdA
MNAPTRRRTNITVEADLLDEARALGLNVSAIARAALAAEVAKARQEAWQAENRAAFASVSSWIQENGVPLDRYRRF